MEKLHAFLDSRPAIRLHYEHEGSFAQWARHFVARLPLGQTGRLRSLIVKEAVLQCPGVDPLLLDTQLARYPLISTADHAGLMNYGILYNANLLFSGILGQEVLPYQVAIPTGAIPLNNVSHPRGFFFGGNRFNFFPARLSHVPVALVDEELPSGADGNLAAIIGKEGLRQLDPERRRFLETLFFGYLGFGGSHAGQRFDLAVGGVNARLWKLHFAAEERPRMPDLVPLVRDRVVGELLRQDLADPASLMWRILFDPRTRDIFLDEFTGIPGCWKENGGTQFFWGVNARRGLYPLRVDSALAAFVPLRDHGEAAFALSPESISQALYERRLLPSLFTYMTLLAFVEGFTLLGGFNQVTYLAWMRVAHERCMLRLGDWPAAARVARTLTDGLICGLLPFPQWPSSLDLIWHHNSVGGRFSGNLEQGLEEADLTAMMATPMRRLIQNGVDAMLDVVE